MFGYNESVAVETKMNVPSQKVWDVLGAPGGYKKFHPYLRDHITESWHAVGGRDKMIYNNGGSYDREIILWDEGKRFDMRITENGKKPLKASFQLTPIDENSCKLKVVITAEFLKKIPFPIRWLIIELKLRPVFLQYIDNANRGLAFYSETGKQVRRNQFGSHPDFSPE